MYQKIKNIDISLKTLLQGVDKMALLCTTDLQGRIIDINENFVDATLFDRNELEGSTHRIVNSGFHKKAFFQNMWKTIQAGEIWRGQIKNKKKSGEFFWIDSMILPIKNEQGTISQYVGICFDITERKMYEEQLVLINKKMSQMIFIQENFLFNLSHEIRGPLTSLSGILNHFDHGYISEEELIESGSKLRKDVDFSIELLTHMVNWSNLRSFDEVKNEFYEEISIEEIVEEVIMYLKIETILADQKLQIEISENLIFGKNIVFIYIILYDFFHRISQHVGTIAKASIEMHIQNNFLSVNLVCLTTGQVSFIAEENLLQYKRDLFIKNFIEKKGGKVELKNQEVSRIEICYDIPHIHS